MIDHTGVSVANVAKSKAFYRGGAGAARLRSADGGGRLRRLRRRAEARFLDRRRRAQRPADHVAFSAASRAQVDAFYKAAIAAGGRDNGPPGLRPQYHPNYYGAFVLDPDGHNIEAVCHAPA